MQSETVDLPVADRLWAWFDTNKKPVLLGTGAVLVVALALWFIADQREQKEIAASRALSNVAADLMTGASPRTESAEAYLKVVANYPNSTAAARASVLAAASLFSEGKYAEAQSQFEKFIRTHQGSPFLEQALYGVGASLDAQGKTDAAITAYKDLVARHPGASVVPMAKLALGRLYEAQSKPELARDQYEDVQRQASPFSALANDAGARLEELLARYPQLVPVPAPAPTNAPFKLNTK
jgi:TolA-binding protein